MCIQYSHGRSRTACGPIDEYDPNPLQSWTISIEEVLRFFIPRHGECKAMCTVTVYLSIIAVEHEACGNARDPASIWTWTLRGPWHFDLYKKKRKISHEILVFRGPRISKQFLIGLMWPNVLDTRFYISGSLKSPNSLSCAAIQATKWIGRPVMIHHLLSCTLSVAGFADMPMSRKLPATESLQI